MYVPSFASISCQLLNPAEVLDADAGSRFSIGEMVETRMRENRQGKPLQTFLRRCWSVVQIPFSWMWWRKKNNNFWQNWNFSSSSLWMQTQNCCHLVTAPTDLKQEKWQGECTIWSPFDDNTTKSRSSCAESISFLWDVKRFIGDWICSLKHPARWLCRIRNPLTWRNHQHSLTRSTRQQANGRKTRTENDNRQPQQEAQETFATFRIKYDSSFPANNSSNLLNFLLIDRK